MSSRSLNKVQLIGNLTRDPELRYTPQGTPVCTFGLATNRFWVPAGGERQEETEFHRIVSWQKLAELCAQLLFKGRKVYVEGRLQTRRWTGADGQERITTEIVIDDMIILDSRRRPEEEDLGVTGTVVKEKPAPEVIAVEAAPVAVKTKTEEAQKTTKKKGSRTTAKKVEKEEKKPEVELTEKDLSDIPF